MIENIHIMADCVVTFGKHGMESIIFVLACWLWGCEHCTRSLYMYRWEEEFEIPEMLIMYFVYGVCVKGNLNVESNISFPFPGPT